MRHPQFFFFFFLVSFSHISCRCADFIDGERCESSSGVCWKRKALIDLLFTGLQAGRKAGRQAGGWARGCDCWAGFQLVSAHGRSGTWLLLFSCAHITVLDARCCCCCCCCCVEAVVSSDSGWNAQKLRLICRRDLQDVKYCREKTCCMVAHPKAWHEQSLRRSYVRWV